MIVSSEALKDINFDESQPYKCVSCKKAFRSEFALAAHNEVHNPKPDHKKRQLKSLFLIFVLLSKYSLLFKINLQRLLEFSFL